MVVLRADFPINQPTLGSFQLSATSTILTPQPFHAHCCEALLIFITMHAYRYSVTALSVPVNIANG